MGLGDRDHRDHQEYHLEGPYRVDYPRNLKRAQRLGLSELYRALGEDNQASKAIESRPPPSLLLLSTLGMTEMSMNRGP